MATRIDTLAGGHLGHEIKNGRASLWIRPGLTGAELSTLLRLNWTNIWNFDPIHQVAEMMASADSDKHAYVISDADDDQSSFDTRTFVRIYDGSFQSNPNASELVKQLKSGQLKLKVGNIGGALIFVGDVDPADLLLVREIAPQLCTCVVGGKELQAGPGSTGWYSGTIDDFVSDFEKQTPTDRSGNLVDLKGAEGLAIPEALTSELGQNWTLLTRKELIPGIITQSQFDSFLNGNAEWTVFAAHGAYCRTAKFRGHEQSCQQVQSIDFHETIAEAVKELDRERVDPRDSLRQIMLLSEAGSGTTTLLRQVAILIGQAGYPVFITNPFPSAIDAKRLTNAIVGIQDLWRKNRQGPGSGSGQIPAVVFVDKDVEGIPEAKHLAKTLASLGREVLLVRAVDRSRDEIEESRGFYTMNSHVEEVELLNLGSHLQDLCARFSLEKLPGREEWRAFHRGLDRIGHFSPRLGDTAYEELPYLFLVGIQPFVSERVSDANSLRQYYFERWDRIPSKNLKKVVHAIAAAGTFNLSVPYNALRRVQAYDLSELESPSSGVHRTTDIFIEWRQEGASLAAWHLRTRHPIIAKLLCQAIDPLEGEFPYRPLLDILKRLSSNSDDVWFAESLAYRIGQSFKRNSPSFSLETDTPVQRAARAIFDSLPRDVKDTSRTVAHHEARYHIHVIHACIRALDFPSETTVAASAVRTVLDAEIAQSNSWLERALKIKGGREGDTNILNTYATLKFAYAKTFRGSEAARHKSTFEEGLDLQEKAVAADSTNGHSLFQFAQQVLDVVHDQSIEWTPQQQLEMLSRAEARIVELVRLHEERRWRNVDPVDAEVQLGSLLAEHLQVIKGLPQLDLLLTRFRLEQPEAAIRIAIRLLLQRRSLSEAFRDKQTSPQLRDLRSELYQVGEKSPRGLLYLYQLFTVDPDGRNEFAMRLDILTELRRKSAAESVAYWHDEASLKCQLDNFAGGNRLFAELRAYRQAQTGQWFWMNERVLLKIERGAPPALRPMTLLATGADGRAKIQGTGITLRYQNQHFPELKLGQPFRAYIRFTINGMQAVTENLADQDMSELGYK